MMGSSNSSGGFFKSFRAMIGQIEADIAVLYGPSGSTYDIIVRQGIDIENRILISGTITPIEDGTGRRFIYEAKYGRDIFLPAAQTIAINLNFHKPISLDLVLKDYGVRTMVDLSDALRSILAVVEQY